MRGVISRANKAKSTLNQARQCPGENTGDQAQNRLHTLTSTGPLPARPPARPACLHS